MEIYRTCFTHIPVHGSYIGEGEILEFCDRTLLYYLELTSLLNAI